MADIAVDVTARNRASGELARVSRDVDRLGQSGQKLGGQWRDANGRLREASGRFAALGQSGGKAAGGVGKLRGIGAGVARVLGPVGLALSAAQAGEALVKFGADSIRAGSDLQQSMGAAEAIFGANVAGIKQAAEGAADGVGLARQEYLQLASVLGAGLKNQGIKDYADQTQRVIGLGADLAAQFGGSTQQAIEAIGSLMRGEADPIERYGVTIKQSAVSAELAKQGLAGLTGEAKTQAEAQARLKLLFEQTATAQGTFAAESGTLAGQQQRLTANMDNLKATIGTGLLPLLTPLVQGVNEVVTGTGRWGEIAREVGAQLQRMYGPALQVIIDAVKGLAAEFTASMGGQVDWQATLQRVIPIAQQVATIFGQGLAGALRVVVAVVGTVVRWNMMLAQGFAHVTVAAIRFGQQIASSPTGQRIWAAIQTGIQAVGFAADFAQGLVKIVGGAISSVGTGVFSTVAGHIRTVGDRASGAVDFVKSIGTTIGNVPLGPFGSIASNISSIVGAAESAIGALGRLAAKVASTPIGRAVQGIAALGRAGGGVLLEAPEAARRITINTQVAPPTVVIDGPSLRAVIRSELRGLVGTRTVGLP